MTVTDTITTTHSSNRVVRLLRGWAAAYVASYETRYVGTAPVDSTIKLRSFPTV